MAAFKDTLRGELKKHNIKMAHIEPNLLHVMSMSNGKEHRMPLAIMGVHEIDSSGEARRCYEWGCAENDNPMHSELPVLRELLLGQWQSLRNQAIDKVDAELQKRSDETWQERRRKKEAEKVEREQREEEQRQCPKLLKETVTEMTMTLEKKAKALELALGELATVRTELASMKKKLSTETAEHATVQAELASMTKKLSTETAEHATIRAELASMTKKLSTETAEHKETQSELSNSKRVLATIEQVLTTTKEELSTEIEKHRETKAQLRQHKKKWCTWYKDSKGTAWLMPEPPDPDCHQSKA